MAKATKNLVIVESPSKAKTIGKYLGSAYQVEACMGHLRDLPKSTMSVDIENDFTPQYSPMKGKEALIAELQKASKSAACVYLATDPDREGEAISWHLKQLLSLPDEKTKRVTFNEITKNVVTRSINEPRDIDQSLVDAQQARRILDRIVGYQLSPLLWKKIRRGLSAGRVQSVATRLVVEREQEIEAFVPVEYWTIDALLQCIDKPGSFTARYFGDGAKRELHSEQETDAILADIQGKAFTIRDIKRTQKRRSPTPPFITSTLQQEASRKLNMTPRRAMSIAQQLYEGVDITGEGTVGLITYMRTDSLRLSEEATSAARDFIVSRYGAKYHPGTVRQFRKKSGAQDAHEAIRPSNVRLDPEEIKGDLTREQYRLYKLIWSRFVACQMADALYDAVQIDSVCEGHIFRANDQIMKFAGFTAVYEEGRDDESVEATSKLPDLDGSERLLADKTEKNQHFTQPPARYTEATLVKAMEERGVGRPSTYAAIVATIQDREYVLKKDKRLYPTPLGNVVTDLMVQHFNDVIDVEFTANMEGKLDDVEAGKTPWKNVLRDFYKGFHEEMLAAEEALDGVRIKVPAEVTDEICELCGRQMVIKSGRFGRFLACPGFPDCKNTKPIVEKMPGRCPKCAANILKRKSKKGYVYYACERGAECGFMTWDVPTANDCPACGQTLFKKSGKGQMKPFCINEKCPQFLPEDKRGYKRKMPAATTQTVENAEEIAQATPKKSAPKKAATKKKPAAKKPRAKK
ncbi:MAG: type I DNA topoisomerase [Oscillospiraceae bacterium]|jgi:DNA topoisomerase-1|nr:type I DNA topoisomerase [Oscillospiraceae bacterium]